MTARHRVAIVGRGFGGLAAAKPLRRAPVDVTVVDRSALPAAPACHHGGNSPRQISRSMSGEKLPDDEMFAGAARAIAMGGDR
jgi:flavin-dependent dehydrogenase